jgi:hypothetical protein
MKHGECFLYHSVQISDAFKTDLYISFVMCVLVCPVVSRCITFLESRDFSYCIFVSYTEYIPVLVKIQQK